MEKQDNNVTKVSPLYGTGVARGRRSINVDVNILAEDEIIYALEDALDIYMQELDKKKYSTLTMNSYASAVSRFIDFLREGEVIPDQDRFKKEEH